MKYEYSRPDLEQALLAARNTQALETAMREVSLLIREYRKPEIFGRQLFCRGLDATVPVIAQRLGLADAPLEKSNDNVCIVGSEFYDLGGHSKVAHDISQLIGGARTTAVLTDIYRQMDHLTLMSPRKVSALRSRATIVLSEPTLLGKTFELYNTLAAIRPTRVFLLNHHFDLPALIALWPFRSVVEFLHHTDHLPGLGATLAWSAHVDLTWTCHQACVSAGLPATYAAMTVRPSDAGGPRPAPLAVAPKSPGALRIATCGSLSKYVRHGAWRWSDYAIAALGAPTSDLIHIGPVSEAFRNEIHGALAAPGIAPERYVFAGASADLAADLKTLEVDVYLSSYPETGGKANLEAMSAGLPPIVATDADSPDLLHYGFPLRTWIPISHPDELQEAIKQARGGCIMTAEDRAAVEAEIARFNHYVLDVGHS